MAIRINLYKFMNDGSFRWAKSYFPRRKFSSVKEIWDYTASRYCGDGFFFLSDDDEYFKDPSIGHFYDPKGSYSKAGVVKIEIEGIIHCMNCKKIFDEKEFEGFFEAGFGIRHLSCPECGEQSMSANA